MFLFLNALDTIMQDRKYRLLDRLTKLLYCGITTLLVSTIVNAGEPEHNLTIQGQPIHFVLPPTYCVLDRNSKEGSAWHSYYERLNEGVNAVLLLFVKCEELSVLRSHPDHRIREYGQYLRQLIGGRTIPQTYTRQYYLSLLTQKTPKLVGQSIAEAATERMERLGEGGSVNSISLGVLDTNDNAVFMGIGVLLKQRGSSIRTGVVAAFTLVKQLPITINLVSDYTNGEMFARLLDAQRLLAARFVTANP